MFKNFKSYGKGFKRNSRLQGAVSIEYVVLLVCIALAALVAFGFFGSSIKGIVSNTNNMIIDKISNATNGSLGEETASGGNDTVTYLSLDDNYVGYYADINSDGTADGVIFFDYAHGATTDAGYLDTGVAVETKTTDLANYKLIGENLVQKVESGDDRFYVIAFEDIKPASGDDTAYWYESLLGSADTSKTSTDFGAGKTNTITMKAIWESGTPAQNNSDMWSSIPDGWFVPSRDEWSVLGSELNKVSTEEYFVEPYTLTLDTNAGASLSFNGYYWSSSLSDFTNAWSANFAYSYMFNAMYERNCVRLTTTF